MIVGVSMFPTKSAVLALLGTFLTARHWEPKKYRFESDSASLCITTKTMLPEQFNRDL